MTKEKRIKTRTGWKMWLDAALVGAVVVLLVVAYHRFSRPKKSEVQPGPETPAIERPQPQGEEPVFQPERQRPPVPSGENTRTIEMEWGYRGPTGSSPQGALRGEDPAGEGAQPVTGGTQTPGPSEGQGAQNRPEYSDGEPPDLISIRFDPDKASPGTEVGIHILARDNLSGVQSVAGSVKNPSGTALLPFGAQPLDPAGAFVAYLQVPDRAEQGAWTVASLRLTDNVHNTRRYSERDAPLSAASLQVMASDSDSTPPEILSVVVEPQEVNGGEKVTMYVRARDDKSGVERAYGAFMSPSGNARLSFMCRPPESSEPEEEVQTLSGETTLPQDAESGDWLLQYIRAEDGAKNGKTFSRTEHGSVLENAVIRVYAAGSDALPPSLDDLTVTPPSVVYGESVEILVDASDDVSGVSHVTGRLQSPSGKGMIPFACSFDQSNGIYRGKVPINVNTEVGTWRVEYIQMADLARNQAVYRYQDNALVAEATFEVAGE